MRKPCAAGDHDWQPYRFRTTRLNADNAKCDGWRCSRCEHTKESVDPDEFVWLRYQAILSFSFRHSHARGT